ncbi:MAG: 16S rRNA (cytosine(1402)-N(4))-methyltransferase RsmH [Pseudomonadota bacterium]
MAHLPVLEQEVIDGMALKDSGIYIDATFGRGGHSAAILGQLGAGGMLLAIDRDETAVMQARKNFADDSRFSITHAAFSELGDIAASAGVAGKVDGVLFDFGVSSPQLDEADRGFSFLRDGPLDMRMDRRQSLTAETYLASVSETALRRDIATLGEEKLAPRIARAIVAARAKAPLKTTGELAAVVEASVPARVRARSKRHPATQTFQAIRMRVNDELAELNRALEQVLDVLSIGGRACFITFHSLEDRPVKRFLRDACAEDPVYRGLPDMPAEARPRMRLVGKPKVAANDELAANPRSRSARLRIAERLR